MTSMKRQTAFDLESVPSYRRQIARLDEIAREPASFEQLPVDPKTYDRARSLVNLLWKDAGPDWRSILEQAFLTMTGGGEIQIEWQIADRYFELEVLPDGPFPYYSEDGREEIEGIAPSAAMLVKVLRKFWNA
jgi:hypothetical protein